MACESKVPLRWRTRSTVAALIFLIECTVFCHYVRSQQETPSEVPITTAYAAKFLPASQAEKKIPIKLRGVVTAVPEGWKGFFIEDATCGIYCEPQNTEAEKSFWPVRVGEEIELEGVTSPGHRNSFVAVTKIVSRKPGRLPQPPLRTVHSLIQDRVDADFVRVRGHIVGLINIAGQMEYGLYADGIEALVIHAGFRIDPKVYEHSIVEICGPVIPQEGNSRPVKIVVPNAESFRMLATHLEVIESTKLSSIESVLRQDEDSDPVVRISADLYSSDPNSLWLVENGFGIEWTANRALLPENAKHVELLAILHGDALHRSLKYGTVLSTSDKLNENEFHPSATIDDIAGHLNRIITIDATFWDANLINSKSILSFDIGDAKLTCRILEEPEGGTWPSLRRGAVYRVTGLLTPDSIERPGSSALVIRSLKDVVMVTGPPWSLRFTLYVVSLLSAGLTIGLLTTLYCWRQTRIVGLRLQSARDALRQANETLEARVIERTSELDKMNRKLIDEATARLNVERDQKQTLESLEDAQSLAQIGSFSWHAASNTSIWSKQCFLVHGLSVKDCAPTLDQYCLQVYDEDREAFKAYLHKAAMSAEREEFRYRITLQSGELRWVRSLIKSVKSADGTLIAMEGIVQNVTEQVAAEEQLSHSVKMEVAGHMAGGIAHDLNNTLTIIKMNCFLLAAEMQSQNLSPDLASHVVSIEAAADKSAMLTRQLLTFSRKQVVRPIVLNVNTTIRNVSSLLAQLLGNQITVQFELAEQIADVRLDQGQLEQLIMNLILNARDAICGRGQIRIKTCNTTVVDDSNLARWSLPPKCGKYVSISVADNGTGIPPELIHKIFEPFFSTKAPEKGTGLGLAVVHGIIRQNKGGLLVESDQNQGATFTLLIPVANEADYSPDKESLLDDHFKSPLAVTSNSGESLSILLVDDEQNVCVHTESVLKRLGYKVTTLTSPTDALALVRAGSENIQLLLTDYSMPRMSGFELAREIRKYRPNLPVIVMSGFLNEEAFPNMPDGLDPVFVQKPFAIQDLATAIRSALRQFVVSSVT